jgi:hypothetical protein
MCAQSRLLSMSILPTLLRSRQFSVPSRATCAGIYHTYSWSNRNTSSSSSHGALFSVFKCFTQHVQVHMYHGEAVHAVYRSLSNRCNAPRLAKFQQLHAPSGDDFSKLKVPTPSAHFRNYLVWRIWRWGDHCSRRTLLSYRLSAEIILVMLYCTC